MQKSEVKNLSLHIDDQKLIEMLESGSVDCARLGSFNLADIYRGGRVNANLREVLRMRNIIPIPLVSQRNHQWVKLWKSQARGIMRMSNVEQALLSQNSQSILGKRNRYKSQDVGGGLVHMAMGEGKTLMVLCLCLSRKSTTGNPSLVITHKGLIDHWRGHIEQFFETGSIKALYLYSDSSNKDIITNDIIADYDIVVTSYDTCRSVMRKISYYELTAERLEHLNGRLGKTLGHSSIEPSDYLDSWKNTTPKVGAIPLVEGGRGSLLYSIEWERIICDESQRMSNGMTHVARSLMALASKRRWCITGTPMRNGTSDLASQLHFCGAETLHEHGKPMEVSEELLSAYIISLHEPIQGVEVCKRVRKMDTSVPGAGAEVKDVPQFTNESDLSMENDSQSMKQICIKLKMTPNQAMVYKLLLCESTKGKCKGKSTLAFVSKLRQCAIVPHVVGEWLLSKRPSLHNSNPELVKWLKNRDGTSGNNAPKLNCLNDIVSNSLPDEKVVVFSEFYKVLSYAVERLENGGNICRVLHGGLKLDQREKILHEFKHSKSIKVLFATYQVGGEGLHLVEANHVVFLDMWWNHQVIEQALARCLRSGQTREVISYALSMLNSVEMYMSRVCSNKLDEMSWFAYMERGERLYKTLLESECKNHDWRFQL